LQALHAAVLAPHTTLCRSIRLLEHKTYQFCLTAHAGLLEDVRQMRARGRNGDAESRCRRLAAVAARDLDRQIGFGEGQAETASQLRFAHRPFLVGVGDQKQRERFGATDGIHAEAFGLERHAHHPQRGESVAAREVDCISITVFRLGGYAVRYHPAQCDARSVIRRAEAVAVDMEAAVAKQLGLLNYWKTSHTRPDVCRTNDAPPFCRMI